MAKCNQLTPLLFKGLINWFTYINLLRLPSCVFILLKHYCSSTRLKRHKITKSQAVSDDQDGCTVRLQIWLYWVQSTSGIPQIRPNFQDVAEIDNNINCDHMVQVSVDISLWFDGPMFRAFWHQSMSTYFQPSFSSSTWKRSGVWMCKLSVVSREWLKIEVKLLLSANRKPYMSCRLAQQCMTLSDLEWPFHGSSTSSASCAISR